MQPAAVKLLRGARADQWSRSRSSPGGELSRGTLLGTELNASKWKEREMKLKQAVQTGYWKQWRRKAAWSQPVLCILRESSRRQCLRGAVWGGGVRAAWWGSAGTNLSDKHWQANLCSEVLCHPRQTVMFIGTNLLQHLGYKDRVTLLLYLSEMSGSRCAVPWVSGRMVISPVCPLGNVNSHWK